MYLGANLIRIVFISPSILSSELPGHAERERLGKQG
jgi:hypothetical protein